jgi:hypothetical protein
VTAPAAVPPDISAAPRPRAAAADVMSVIARNFFLELMPFLQIRRGHL